MSTGSRNGKTIHPRRRGSHRPGRGGIGNGVGRLTVLILLAATLAGCARQDSAESDAAYMCPPCHVHGDLFFEEDGTCPVCGMALIERPDSSEVGEAHIHPGAGNFLMEGGPGHAEKLVQVFYHMPETFTPDSPILIVVPGAGRDADEYRDAWVEASREHGVLVLSPMYREDEYGFGAYHMGGLMEAMNLGRSVLYEEGSNRAHLDEERFDYRVNPDADEWIFDDFDRLFERVAAAVGSEREEYDVFGHSAGGQILHRLVLFDRRSRAGRILAANSGFYTMPDTATSLPFGVADAPVTVEDLKDALGRPLVLFLGAEDDADEKGGTLLRSPTVDRQGLHRLARGRSFHRTGEALANRLDTDFAWELRVIAGVGHDFRGMSAAAADYLYGDEESS